MNRLLKVLAAVCLVLLSVAAVVFVWTTLAARSPAGKARSSAGSSKPSISSGAATPRPGSDAPRPLFSRWFTVPSGHFFLGSTRQEVEAAQPTPTKQTGVREIWSWSSGRAYFDSQGRVSQYLDYRGVKDVSGEPVSRSTLNVGADPVSPDREQVAFGSSMATVLARYGPPGRAEIATDGVYFEYQSEGTSGWLRFSKDGRVDILESQGFFDGFYGRRDAQVPAARGE